MAGNVNHLDTVNFNDTIAAYANHISQFENIVKGVNDAVDMITDHWQGKGRNAFEKDSAQVKLNLKDISDIMYNLRDALIEAHADYMQTDSSLSKSYES